jgi:hypothetical protein
MTDQNQSPFGLPPGRISIKSFDEPNNQECSVIAQFNPKELEIKKTVTWSKPPDTSKGKGKKNEPGIHLEFGGAEPRTMTIELLFDGFETSATDSFYIADVAKEVAKLEKLASVRDTNPKAQEKFRRPHKCVVAWGTTFGDGDGFLCVIDSLTTKYTMFSPDGTPLRATCTVSLKEANFLELAKKGK